MYGTIGLTIKKESFCVWMGMIRLVNSEEASVRAALSETPQFSGQRRPPHNDRVLELWATRNLLSRLSLCQLLSECLLLKLSKLFHNLQTDKPVNTWPLILQTWGMDLLRKVWSRQTYVTLDHKTSQKGPFSEIEIYAPSESRIDKLSMDVWFVQ